MRSFSEGSSRIDSAWLSAAVDLLLQPLPVFLQEKGGKQMFQDKNLQLQYRLDNEFDLVFVVNQFLE